MPDSEPKRGPGRPALGADKRIKVNVYLRPSEIVIMDALALAEGLSRSDWLRAQVLQGTVK